MHYVVPEQVGMSSARLARINPACSAMWTARRARGQLAGLVTLVARRGSIVHHEAFGMSDLESGRPMRTDDIVCLWSMSKPVTSVAALMLYEEGRFLLDDPISRFAPGFERMKVAVSQPDGSLRLEPLESEITFRHLLTHTSGLGYGGRAPSPDDPFNELYYQCGAWQVDTLAEFARRLPSAPWRSSPGRPGNTAWVSSCWRPDRGHLGMPSMCTCGSASLARWAWRYRLCHPRGQAGAPGHHLQP